MCVGDYVFMAVGLADKGQKLPVPPSRRRSFQPVPSINLEAVASSSRIPYEPPSPARPWQLMDVLWQPLPPPSRGPMSPGSPVSPSVQRRRSKRDEIRFEEGAGALSNGALPGGHHLPVHRRASSAAMMAYLSHDPYPVQSGGRIRKEKRSQSHSHTTTQDVDAAKALTAMLGGGGSANGTNGTPFMPGTPPRHRSSSAQRRAPSTAPPRPSRRSGSTTREYDPADRLRVDASAANRHEDEDTDAAELMMFLAHSPSAAGTRRYSPLSDSASSSSMGGAARVLFADGPHDPPKQQQPPVGSSNLALAPPITAGSLLSGSED